MKIIMLQDVKSIGKKGELVDTSDGYARNYLLPRKLAKIADAQSLNELKNAEDAKAYKKKVEKEEAVKLSELISDKTLKISSKAGKNGKLFGAVTTKELAASLKNEFDITIDKRKIELDGDIKAFGTYEFNVKLPSGIVAKMYVSVGEEA